MLGREMTPRRDVVVMTVGMQVGYLEQLLSLTALKGPTRLEGKCRRVSHLYIESVWSLEVVR